MCQQCLTNSLVIKREVIPGYSLHLATRGTGQWPEGWFGLIRSNDPTFVFPGPLLPNPLFAYPMGQEPDSMYDTPEFDQHLSALQAFRQALEKSPNFTVPVLYDLFQAIDAAGYPVFQEHLQPDDWLLHQLALGLAEFEAMDDQAKRAQQRQ